MYFLPVAVQGASGSAFSGVHFLGELLVIKVQDIVAHGGREGMVGYLATVAHW